jgi:hypothetical protein
VDRAQGQSYLGRALGFKPQLEIDYQTQPVEQGDIFLLATDGVYEHVSEHDMAGIIRGSADAPDLEAAAKAIVDKAFQRGSDDNLTAQIVRVDALPAARPARWCSSFQACRCRPSWRPGRCLTATPSSAKCTAAAAATSTWPPTTTPERWSSSRRRRSTCSGDPAYL